MIPEIGQRLGPYEILDCLGLGGMGLVYRAWDGRLHREVAIKLLHSDFPMPGSRERFLREARAASGLNHPNICTIFDIGEQDGEPYLVMELLEGETAKARIARSVVSSDELVVYAREIAGALGAAHARGIVHRDVKPANIFLSDIGEGARQAKVLDFGLAKLSTGRADRSLDLTTAGATVGTVAYMSPEQARGEELDARSDLFSLGVVLYEMATRQTPFRGTTSALIFVQLLGHDAEPVREWNQAIPRDLEKIIHRLLAKPRGQRYQSAQELLQALSQLGKPSNGWFQSKPAERGVPLVRAADPVARARRPMKRPSGGYAPAHYEADREPYLPLDPLPDKISVLRPVAHTPSDSRAEQPGGQPQKVRTPQPGPRLVAGGAVAAVTPIPASVTPRPRPAEATPVPRAEQRPVGRHVHYTFLDGLDDISEPAAFAESQPAPPAEPLPESEPRTLGRRFRIGAMLALLAVGAAYWWTQHTSSRPVFAMQDTLIIASIQNQTGDASLNGVVNEGLALQMQQAGAPQIRGVVAYESGLRQLGVSGSSPPDPETSRKVAQAVGARAYLSGSLTGTSPYALSLTVLYTDSNERIASVEETAVSREQIVEMIGQAADALHAELGPGEDATSQANAPEHPRSTGSVEALHAYAMAEAAIPYGRLLDTLTFLQQAVALDPKFPQAQIALVWALHRQNAETAAADASRAAQAAASEAGERTRAMAHFAFEINETGDLNRALGIARDYAAHQPSDADGFEALARVLRQMGHLQESLQAAQAAIEIDPYRLDAYTEAGHALLGLDRYDAALQMDVQAQRIGLGHVGASTLARYLSLKQGASQPLLTLDQLKSAPLSLLADDAVLLDNTGKLSLGRDLWHAASSHAGAVPGLESGAGLLLAQGALNRALAGDCEAALGLARQAGVHPQGPVSVFDAGIAEALCGDIQGAQDSLNSLQRDSHSWAASGFLVPDLKAAMLLRSGNPVAALDALKPARPYDLVSLTPYVRGLAHLGARQTQLGIVDFQIVLAHRGTALLSRSIVYPMAQFELARAYAQGGDTANSARAYSAFLDLWNNGDRGQPTMLEARAHTR